MSVPKQLGPERRACYKKRQYNISRFGSIEFINLHTINFYWSSFENFSISKKEIQSQMLLMIYLLKCVASYSNGNLSIEVTEYEQNYFDNQIITSNFSFRSYCVIERCLYDARWYVHTYRRMPTDDFEINKVWI